MIFGNAGFDFADEIGTHVGGLRINSATHTSEEGD